LNRCLGHISQSQVFVVRELRLYWPDNALLWLLIPLGQLHDLFTHHLPGGFLLPPVFSIRALKRAEGESENGAQQPFPVTRK
jgi:hypothetical protein